MKLTFLTSITCYFKIGQLPHQILKIKSNVCTSVTEIEPMNKIAKAKLQGDFYNSSANTEYKRHIILNKADI
jgi:hypothetical protein